MWIFWAVIAMVGSLCWYIGPKIFPTQNLFTPILVSSIVGIFFGLIGSKLAHKTWFDPKAIPLGLFLSLSWIGTAALYQAFLQGGRVGPVTVIIELCVLFAAGVAYFFFQEKLNATQVVGIFMAVIGTGLVLFFEKQT